MRTAPQIGSRVLMRGLTGGHGTAAGPGGRSIGIDPVYIEGLPNSTITLTGDATGAGANTIPVTLATVNSNIGTYNNITINAKGLATAGSHIAYLTGNQTITISGDIAGSGTTAITATLPNVNSNVGTFQGITVNAKGQVTAAANQNYVTGGPYLPLNGGTLYRAAANDFFTVQGDSGYRPRTVYSIVGGQAWAVGADTALGLNVFTISDNTAGLSRININTSGVTTINGSATVNGSANDPLQVTVPSGSYGRTRSTVTGTRTWAFGTRNDGFYGTSDENASAWRLVIDTSGGCTNTTGTWSAISDRRLKSDITPYGRGLEEIRQLRPVSFRYHERIAAPGQRHGLIADEVAGVIPEVCGEIDIRGPDDDAPDRVSTVNPGDLVYPLINAIKELAARVEALEAQLAVAG